MSLLNKENYLHEQKDVGRYKEKAGILKERLSQLQQDTEQGKSKIQKILMNDFN